ncbi:hypothetical protein COY65_00640 [Candidatus Jorgensenbacteria bacterium CG_4_10_14_0_8_um_filter_39_13]|uniref:Heat-inducible transcription repressor HrcA C-terminal domain-containing protein n=1 Tax=Candidatus Jorgensenbacteria bacterium CG_4_10_14_0_8_um_filter_39_13 TaxID=1974589 RepID=A0A2M7RI77_9BACT|nr:MAG: hypothetical protein COS46_02610 [Candidatus Jorgensenbacteria bacterium CG03_land_8_20_14_0_80_38_39]PIW97728.1 MAG: hypothetical protein COZ81_01040 [Candidatus Jorgensenbacteria bacterium CG_4_8_14_3_um_filter_38_10]PIY96463.1 MAG: hypothetical protein COY65_00640 [Candidatus Jorgensenbacteria bacterium CG_4_10_14_0_8_um_filter_39_13]PJA95256.1 MAG: hypothetical protein CO130_00050 [Candidatus Jorgensenbacteria bacterium CG_4_9_14_3_um_filter_38_10]
MLERKKAILTAGLRDFIKTGKPVTSENLYQNHRFNIKPAMIRAELHSLTTEGYFYQKHSSGGRLPSNKAYRFFVDEISNPALEDSFEQIESLAGLIEYFKEGKKDNFIEQLAKELRILSVGYEPLEKNFYQSGFEQLVRQLEFEMKSDFLEVVEDFEFLPKRLSGPACFWQHYQNWPQVFIGRSPVTSCPQLSLIADEFEKKGKIFLLLAIGPKRMDYQKSLKTLKVLKNSLKNG